MSKYLEFKKNLFIIFYLSKILIKLLIVDQLSKWWFIEVLKEKPNLELKVTSFLDFVYVWNYGISFGIFKNYYQYSNAIFLLINLIICFYLIYLLINYKTELSFYGYSFIIGGAIGNILDRVFRGAVFDFIYFHYKDYGFPIFNLADAFISVGAIILIYDYYKEKKSIEMEEDPDYDALEMEAEEIRKLSDEKFNSEENKNV